MARRDSQKTSSATFNGAAPTGFDKLQRAWSVTLPNSGYAGAYGDSVSLDENDNAYVTTGDAIFKLAKQTGATLWVSTLPATNFTQPAISNNGVVVTSSVNAIVAFSTDTGQHLWTYRPVGVTATDLAGTTASIQYFDGDAHPVIDPTGQVLASSYGENGSASGLRRAIVGLGLDGSFNFAITKGGGFNSSIYGPAVSSPTAGSPVLYFKTSDSGNLYSRLITGGASGNYSDGFSDGDGAKVAVLPNDDLIHYVNSTGRKLERRNPSLLTNVWITTQTLTNRVWTPAVNGSSVIYATADGRLYGFDFATGNTVLNMDMDVDDQYSLGPPTVVSSDTVMFTGQRNFETHLYNVNTGTRQLRWRYTLNTGNNVNLGQVTVSTHAIYVHTLAAGVHKVHAFIKGTYASIAISSTPESRSGNLLVSTVTVTALDASLNPVPGVPIQLTQTNVTSGIGYTVTPLQTQDNLGYSTTAANGTMVFRVAWDYSSWTPTMATVISSTLTFTPLGLAPSSVLLQNTFASTFTVTASTPSIEDSGTDVVRVTTVTFTVSNSTGGRVTNFPVALNALAYTSNLGGSCGTPSSVSPANFQMTNSTGQATFVYRVRIAAGSGSSLFSCVPYDTFPSLTLPLQAFSLALPAASIDAKDTRPSTFTVSFSSPALQADVRNATMTVTVFDAAGSTVPAAVVALNNLTSNLLYSFNNYKNDGTGVLCTGSSVMGYTNSLGQAKFLLDHRPCAAVTFDNFNDFISSQPVFTPNIAVATATVFVESNFLASYQVSVPTITSVGVSFRSTVTAVNVYGHQLPKYTESGVTLTPLFDQTAVQGTGTLGTSVVSFAGSGGAVVISSQTYNKIEDIQIKATRGSGSIKTGLSGTLVVRGPTQFIVTVPTSAPAGVPFSITIRAVDASSTPVVGYAGTLSLSALNAGNQTLAGAGVLGTTSVNMPANGVVTIANQTYTKAESIVIRASDSGAGIAGVSTTTLAVRAGTPAVITMLANPQSTIAGVPTVLTATIFDGFSNAVSNSTATFSVATGSGVVSLSLSNGSVVSAVTSTQAVTDAFGQATAFFSSTNSLSAQANVLRASLGALARDTTVYTTVLVTSAGGAVVNFANPQLRADVPANTYGFSVRLGIQSKSELSATDLAMTTAAFAATANTFVSTTVLKLSAVRDASPTVAAGAGSKFITVKMPYSVTSGSISVGAYGAQSILVPLSVMRVFKLNQTSSVFEQVLDGATAVDSLNGTISAEVSDPDGVYVLGAPAFTNLTTGSSATVTTALAGGTSAQVIVPQGGFSSPATISVTVPGAAAVPALPTRAGLTGTGITISVSAGGLQPTNPVTVKIGYRPIDVAGINPDYLRLARYDASTGWVVLDSSADSATRQVIGTTNHFSLFQIVAQAPGASVADAFVFPNPFRPALGHTNIKLSNLPAAAHVKIYTATGRLLKELDADAAGQVLTWNGTDRDGRALASGVYLAVIEGTGGRRTIKFAVQR